MATPKRGKVTRTIRQRADWVPKNKFKNALRKHNAELRSNASVRSNIAASPAHTGDGMASDMGKVQTRWSAAARAGRELPSPEEVVKPSATIPGGSDTASDITDSRPPQIDLRFDLPDLSADSPNTIRAKPKPDAVEELQKLVYSNLAEEEEMNELELKIRVLQRAKEAEVRKVEEMYEEEIKKAKALHREYRLNVEYFEEEIKNYSAMVTTV